jgi:hypothetical protein
MNTKGMVQLYVLSLLSIFVMTGLSLMGIQHSSMGDFYDMKDNSQARFLASSALQEARYFIMRIDGLFSGTSAEQVVSVNGQNVGTYEYTVSNVGRIFTVTGRGYVPNKTAAHKIQHEMTSTFYFDYIGVGVVLLGANASGALTMSGNSRMNILGGKLIVNSSHATGTVLSNNAQITAPSIGLVGGYTAPAGGITGTITTGINPVSDPLAHLPVPVPADLGLTVQSAARMTITGTSTLQPGVYQGGLAISADANVTLAPGIYYIEGGGMSVTGNANLTGAGVFIYNLPLSNSDSIDIGGNGNISISGPTSGDYRDVTFFQERTSTVPASFGGNGSVSVSGDFYFPNANLTLQGNSSGTTLGSLHVAAGMSITGNGTVNVNADTP